MENKEHTLTENELKKLPPFTQSLLSHALHERDDFDTPGHHSGAFYEMTEEGNIFTKGLGKNAFLADISDSSSLIGDPFSHEGVSGMAEEMAARTWQSDLCRFVLGGTSTSNRICASALPSENDLVLFDRNNHKSTYQGALIQAGARAVYLGSERNGEGVIDTLDPAFLDSDFLRKKAAAIDPSLAQKERPFRLACLQLATYDGLFLNAKMILEKLGPLCDYILFDGAWAGYENFIPLLKDSAVLTFPLGPEDPGILVTQSVHKQLAGFSQTSQIHKKDSHIKGEKRCLPDDILDSAFLMNISTSPYYPLFAGLEMNALIHRKYGKELWEEAFRFSIHLRKKLLKNLRFIRPFLPPIVHGRKWEEADDKEIMNDPAFFSISKDYAWHGFSHAEDGLSMIDPCKILLTSGSLKEYKEGIPAPLISMYLESKGITPEKSDFCTILFLAEPGDKEGKAKRLVSALADLEKAFEENRPVSEILPECSSLPEEDIRDLSSRFFHFLHEKNVFSLLNTLFSSEHFPDAPMTGRKANQLWLSGKGEKCPLAEAEGRTTLEAVLPYPPGICLLAAGETWTKDILSYFLFLEEYGREFPSFMPEVVGLHKQDGKPYVWVLSKDRG